MTSSTASLVAAERSELCDLMLELGPEAPTLNEGWDVVDLAAHLVAREHDIWAAPGLVLGGPFAKMTELATRRRRRQGLDALVARIREGEPGRWKRVPRAVQLNEYYLHHEDVRRANGLEPRTDRADLDARLLRLVKASASRYLKGFTGGVELLSGGDPVTTVGEAPHASVEGPPGELLLFLSGRREAARVKLGGDQEVSRRLSETDLEI